jgi:hypothetical protein
LIGLNVVCVANAVLQLRSERVRSQYYYRHSNSIDSITTIPTTVVGREEDDNDREDNFNNWMMDLRSLSLLDNHCSCAYQQSIPFGRQIRTLPSFWKRTTSSTVWKNAGFCFFTFMVLGCLVSFADRQAGTQVAPTPPTQSQFAIHVDTDRGGDEKDAEGVVKIPQPNPFWDNDWRSSTSDRDGRQADANSGGGGWFDLSSYSFSYKSHSLSRNNHKNNNRWAWEFTRTIPNLSKKRFNFFYELLY